METSFAPNAKLVWRRKTGVVKKTTCLGKLENKESQKKGSDCSKRDFKKRRLLPTP